MKKIIVAFAVATAFSVAAKAECKLDSIVKNVNNECLDKFQSAFVSNKDFKTYLENLICEKLGFNCGDLGEDNNSSDDIQKPEADKPSDDTTNEENVQKPSDDNTNQENTQKPSDDVTTENASYQERVAELVNKERAKYGIGSLFFDKELSKAASLRAKECFNLFSHTRPDGRSCFTVLSDMNIKYSGAGENIAYGQSSPEEVVNAWMNSEGHRANILNSAFTKIGVGCENNGSTLYWAQIFTY